MSYSKRVGTNTERRKSLLSTADDLGGNDSFFYELEPAIVYKVILDDDDEQIPKIESGISSKDYSYVGRVVCRPIYSHEKTPIENLPIAIPIENNIVEYPLKNEMVVVAKYLGRYYYFRKLNAHNLVNSNFDYAWDKSYGVRKKSKEAIHDDINSSIAGSTNVSDDASIKYTLGDYFEENIKVHPLKPYEGDFIIESRFGSSIRFGGYNIGPDGFDGENTQILIRNRESVDTQIDVEFGKHVEENINEDGSSIHITSGDAISKFIPVTEMKIESNEYPNELSGDQIVVNSGRLIFSSKEFEIFGFGKKAIGWITDGVFSVDSKKDIICNTEMNVVINSVQTRINSKKIYLGEEKNEDEPVILGTQLYNWLDSLCNALISETHLTGTGPSSPPVNANQYVSLRMKLRELLSNRTFTV